jgi:hypothetical protein
LRVCYEVARQLQCARGGGGGTAKTKTTCDGATHQGGRNRDAGALEVDDAGLVGVPDAAADRGDAEQQRDLLVGIVEKRGRGQCCVLRGEERIG